MLKSKEEEDLMAKKMHKEPYKEYKKIINKG